MSRFWLVAFCFVSTSLFCNTFPIRDPIPIHEAFATKFPDVGPIQTIAQRPPKPKAENIPAQPTKDAEWVSGYWAWIPENNQFEWICGVWRIPPPKHQWISGYWYEKNKTFAWMRGFWSPVPENHLRYITKPPPNPQTENVPEAPNEDHFWANGHWEYDFSTHTYSWLGGAWQPFDEDWVLAPSHYLRRPEGYVFVPFYWDHPIDHRGTAYECLETGSVIPPDIIVRRLYIHYPDYVSWYWHFWHFHHDWWGDCMCLPPWWHWHGWWAFGPHDHWGMWWWWGHAQMGFPHPFWLNIQFSNLMFPPFGPLIDFLNQFPLPFFLLQNGFPLLSDWLDHLGDNLLLPADPNRLKKIIDAVNDQLEKPDPILLPKGPKEVKDVGRPKFPDVMEAGKIRIPTLPELLTPPPRQIDIPRPPPRRDDPVYTPPTRNRPEYQPRPQPRPRSNVNWQPRQKPRPQPQLPRFEWPDRDPPTHSTPNNRYPHGEIPQRETPQFQRPNFQTPQFEIRPFQPQQQQQQPQQTQPQNNRRRNMLY